MPAIKFSIRGSRRAAAVTVGAVLSAGALGLAMLGSGTHTLATDQVKATAPVTAPAVDTPSASASATPPKPPTPMPSASPGAPSAAATPSAAGTPSKRAAGKPAAPSGNSGTAAPVLDAATSAKVPADLAAVTAQSWTARTPGPVRPITGHDIALNECASVRGAATWQQQPYLSSGGNSAVLEIYTFGAEAAAGAAYEGVRSGMSSCQATSRALQSANGLKADTVARQTATATGAAAFERVWTGVQGISAQGAQTNHLYLAAHGTRVLVLHFDELAGGFPAAAPYDVQQDPNVLSLLTNLLASPAGTR
ncbi:MULTISPECIES: hypothetical protein [unclassified Streptomyces]|uniref:hypothetical protein n=1 Tax=unclassified Streptomyces TaxID=2593676 RepID=UPI002E15B67D|nr:hypothetical protein OG457_09090 [Streptomyces sp. NBC_01207]WTA17379.1 hypothetical protein OG365_04525 [Streptomyces sp. NBC_00853]